MSQYLPTQLQEYVHKSRYARWIDAENRREMWPETVDRYIQYFANKFPGYPAEKLRVAIQKLDVMPSMRALMTAGPALERDPTAGFNCSFIAIDDVRAFDEVLYILMCGTGVGFSVERQYIANLPIVAEKFVNTDITIKVRDSKGGWSNAFRELLALLYSGSIPKWDTSAVRSAGAKLKTFGGRASGPKPLEDLFRFAVDLFRKAAGRRLTSMECHDLVCKVADIVVVGGVRRSALISLSNPSDDRMRHAKSGQWWNDNPQRALANNSAAYTERPDMEVFMKEWLALVESKSGERGIFNRTAAHKKAIESGRRDAEKIAGTNPCFAPGTRIHTKEGTFPIEQLVGKTVSVWDGQQYITIDNFRVTGENQEVLKMVLQDGSEVVATPYHTFVLEDGSKVEMKDLEPGMKLKISRAPTSTAGTTAQGAYLKGFMIGDGSINHDRPLLWLYQPKEMCTKRLLDSAAEIPEEFVKAPVAPSPLGFIQAGSNRTRMQGLTQRSHELLDWGGIYKCGLPSEVFTWDQQSKAEFLAGLFDADGCALDAANGYGYQLCSTSKQLLLDVQELLKTLSCFGKVALTTEAGSVDFNNGYGSYPTQAMYRLTLSQEAAINFSNQVKFERLQSFADRAMKYKLKPRWNAIVSIDHAGVANEVYCCTVPGSHQFSLAMGITTGNCAEISLRSAGLCNLTEVVIRHEDGLQDLLDKVELATILGTYQSMLTDFRYIRNIWKQNQEEERLLGVSLTGIMDHPVLSQTSDIAVHWLKSMKEKAVVVNHEWAEKLGINPAAAITTVKPSGTVSQLVDSASGIHPRYSDYYIRTVRADKKDPLAMLMRLQGFPVEDCVMKPDTTDVFAFPVKSPNHCITRNERSAIDQLDHYLMFQTYWSEHNVSITVYVKDHEWLGVGDWVYQNFDKLSGVSFLPHSDHSYQQAPYTECQINEYEALKARMPEFNWGELAVFERDDSTVNTKELACSAGICEIL